MQLQTVRQLVLIAVTMGFSGALDADTGAKGNARKKKVVGRLIS